MSAWLQNVSSRTGTAAGTPSKYLERMSRVSRRTKALTASSLRSVWMSVYAMR